MFRSGGGCPCSVFRGSRGQLRVHPAYRDRPGKQAKAERRDQQLREPVIRLKIRVQDKMTGPHDLPPIEP
jgi:hypothetical protein